MQEFFMVYAEGQRGSTVKHVTRDQAESEAARLARINPGQVVYVLMPVSSCKMQDIVWERNTDLPF